MVLHDNFPGNSRIRRFISGRSSASETTELVKQLARITSFNVREKRTAD